MIKKLDHLGIKVSDLNRFLKFYQGVLGFKLRERRWISDEMELAYLSLDGQTDISIELVSSTDAVDRVGVVNHLALEVENIEEMLEGLEQFGLEIVDRQPRIIPGQKIAFFWGPDGERLELVQKT